MPRASFTASVAIRIRAAGLGLALLAASATAYAGNADLVNERPTVTRAALEEHWGVDCESLRQELLLAYAESGTRAGRDSPHDNAGPRPTRWRNALQMCAAIYNAPGDDEAVPCPDYARAARALGEDAPGTDAQRHADIGDALRCAP